MWVDEFYSVVDCLVLKVDLLLLATENKFLKLTRNRDSI